MRSNPQTAQYLSALLLLSAVFILPACKKEKNERTLTYRTVGLRLKVQSANGTDLCDPASPGAFTTANTDLFYLAGGQYKQVQGQTLSSHMPENMMFFRFDHTHYQLVVYPSTTVNDRQVSTTLVKFGDHIPDTVRLRYKVVGFDGFADSIWVNSKGGIIDSIFTLIK
jgi:hypothetical protein